MTDKEKIDYEIQAKKAARDKEIAEWAAALWIALVFIFSLIIIFSLLNWLTMNSENKICPVCGKEVSEYHEVTFKEPYIHNNPYDGLFIYGAYSSPKKTICYENNFFHFAFFDSIGELTNHKLIKLGVENPTTKSPSDQFFENQHPEFENLENEDSEFERCLSCDGHDACEDFGCAFDLGLGNLVNKDDLPF